MEYDLEELKHKRKIMGISLRKTAAYMGCSYETVRLIENGILKNPYLISLYKKFIDGCWSGGISYEKAKNFCQHSTVSREEAQHLGAVREVLKNKPPHSSSNYRGTSECSLAQRNRETVHEKRRT